MRTILHSTMILAVFMFTACAATSKLSYARSMNQRALLELRVGMSRADVLETMGVWTRDLNFVGHVSNPYKSESYEAGGHRWEVLFYVTDSFGAPGIAEDELTPVVLKDGALDGWGWRYWEDTTRRYDITVRRR